MPTWQVGLRQLCKRCWHQHHAPGRKAFTSGEVSKVQSVQELEQCNSTSTSISAVHRAIHVALALAHAVALGGATIRIDEIRPNHAMFRVLILFLLLFLNKHMIQSVKQRTVATMSANVMRLILF
jgi:hypothetical protein